MFMYTNAIVSMTHISNNILNVKIRSNLQVLI